MIDEVVAPLLHSNEPVKFDAVNTEFPQWLTTSTVGAGGIGLGAAIPLLSELVQPFTDCVTVYVPGVVTVIDGVVAPLLHNNDPLKFEAVKTEFVQLSVTVTVGATGIAFGAAVAPPAALEQPLTVWVTVYNPPAVTVMESVVAPLLHNKVPV